MLNTLQKLMALLFKPEKEHKHEVTDQGWLKEKIKLQQQLTALTKRSEQLQEKLSDSLAHVTVLEEVLSESNKTIESLQLALDLRETEETEGLQDYLNDLEIEITEAVELIQKYGSQMRKV